MMQLLVERGRLNLLDWISQLLPGLFAIVAFLAVASPASAQQAAHAAAQQPAPPPASNPPAKISPEERLQKNKEGLKLLAETTKLRDEGKFDEAIHPCQQLLDIVHELDGSDNKTSLKLLEMLAFLQEMKEDFPTAERLHREALALAIKLYAKNDWHVTDAQLGLAKTIRLKNFDPLQRREWAESIRMMQLSDALRGQGRFADALPLATGSAELYSRLMGEKSRGYGTCLLRQGRIENALGDYAKAAQLDGRASVIMEDALGKHHPDYTAARGNLAEDYQAMGDYSKAEPIEREVVAIRRATLGVWDPDYAIALNNLAMLYVQIGDNSKAEPLLLQALTITRRAYGEKNRHYTTALHNLADLYQRLHDYAKAKPLYERTLAIEKNLLGEKHPTYAATLYNLAVLDESTGDDVAAESLYRQACDVAKDALGENHPNYAKYLSSLGMLDYELGDFAKAEPLLQQALAIRKRTLGEKHLDYATSLTDLALLYAVTGEVGKADQLSWQALKIAREQLEQTATIESERQQLHTAGRLSFFLNAYLSIATNNSTFASLTYDQVLVWKGAISGRQEAVQRARANPSFDRSPAISKALEDLGVASRDLSNESLVTPAPGAEATHRLKLRELSNRVEQSQQRLAGFGRSMEDLSRVRAQPFEIAHVIPSDAALVDLLEYQRWSPPAKGKKGVWEPRLLAFVLRPGKVAQPIDLGPSAIIADSVAAWRKTYGMPAADGTDPGQALRRLVWDKLEPNLTGAQTILVSPDGALAQFPWGALPGKKPGTYLIEEKSIAVVPIARLLPDLLAQEHSAPSVPPSLLLVGGVDFGSAPPPTGNLALDRGAARGIGPLHWPPLPGTMAEITGVKADFERSYPKTTPLELTGDSATKSAIVSDMAKCRFLHFATHGFFTPLQPKPAPATRPSKNANGIGDMLTPQTVSAYNPDLLSGLVFSGANRPVEPGHDSGILTALEVSDMDLRHVDLVTLSACETGLGTVTSGDGLLGLQRAFQIAGAKAVVASLWHVPDKPTQMLMDRFYANLWNPDKKMSKLEALTEAQRWMLREGRSQPGMGRGIDLGRAAPSAAASSGRLPPFYWAAFILSGDWR